MNARTQKRRWRKGRSCLTAVVVFLLAWPAAAQLSPADPHGFFTLVSSRLLRSELGLELGKLQIYPTNQYTPAAHRLLQVAANLYETTTNADPEFPTVFRPRLGVTNGTVFIRDYVIATNASDLDGLPRLDLFGNPDAPNLMPVDGDALVFGVPLVIGAKKGLPNFNEFAEELWFTISRQVQLRKEGGVITETNQFFTMELILPMAAEFWNSYATNYTQPVSIYVTNYVSFVLTNDMGASVSQQLVRGDNYSTNDWRAFNAFNGGGNRKSLLTLMRTNLPLIPLVGYLPNGGAGMFLNATNIKFFDTTQTLLMPRWGIVISNRLEALIVADSNDKILDHVVLGGMTYQTNLTDIVISPDAGTGNPFQMLWATNPSGDFLSGRPGIIQQICISLGAAGIPPSSEWMSYGKFAPGNPEKAIADFQYFFYGPTNGFARVPYTPTCQFRVPLSWQANDPLVNDQSELLLNREESGFVERIKPPASTVFAKLQNIGAINQDYRPWALALGTGDLYAFDTSLKDPMVRASDEWTFPQHDSLSIANLGQIHRGTPWQTLYLKSSDLGLSNVIQSPTEFALASLTNPSIQGWLNWSGDHDLVDAFYLRPVRDWNVATVLASMLNTNSPHQLLSVNTTDTNAWLATIDGLTVLTNISSDLDLLGGTFPQFDTLLITSDSTAAQSLVQSIEATRALQSSGVFRSLGDLFATPELSLDSPWLDQSSDLKRIRGITDAAYEILPSQLLSRVRADSVGSITPADSGLRVRFTGYDSYPYAVESSTNLINWIGVNTFYPTNGAFEFSVAPTSNLPTHYRSVMVP